MKRVLVMGLPGSGKTFLSDKLKDLLPSVARINADKVRQEFNDWDFSFQGRINQAKRLRELSFNCNKEFVIVDFVAPLKEQREIFDADYTIWMDTIKSSRYPDTDKIFTEPDYNFRITSWNYNDNLLHIIKDITND